MGHTCMRCVGHGSVVVFGCLDVALDYHAPKKVDLALVYFLVVAQDLAETSREAARSLMSVVFVKEAIRVQPGA